MKTEPEMTDLITPKELAKRWRLTVNTLRDMRNRGDGPNVIAIGGRRILYRMDDVIAYEQARTKSGRGTA